MPAPHVQIIVDREPVPTPLRTALSRLGARVSIRSVNKAAQAGISASADVCVIVPGIHPQPDTLERILAHASDHACAAVVLDGRPVERLCGGLAATPDQARIIERLPSPEACGDVPLSADAWAGRILALCEIRRPFRRLHDELSRLRGIQPRLAAPVPELDEQLRLAGQVQADLLPEPLAENLPLRVSTLYLPAGYVSGDIYDVARLDETHIGISIADATGHGLPAALLTFLIKNSLRGKEIFNRTYRIVEPDELLGRLNDDLLRSPLSHCQFLTALNAVFDARSGQIRWARGGCPYPILVRPGRPACLVRSEGGLIGAFEQRFEVVAQDLAPGDVMLFYTDGLDALLVHHEQSSVQSILQTEWIRTLEHEGPEPALQAVRDLAAAVGEADWHRDDITVIAVEVN